VAGATGFPVPAGGETKLEPAPCVTTLTESVEVDKSAQVVALVTAGVLLVSATGVDVQSAHEYVLLLVVVSATGVELVLTVQSAQIVLVEDFGSTGLEVVVVDVQSSQLCAGS
jgi:hypothetical protein